MQLQQHRQGFAHRLHKLTEVVAALSAAFPDRLRFVPPVPEACMVHVYLPGPAPVLDAARDSVVAARNLRVYDFLRDAGRSAPLPGQVYFEWKMGPLNVDIPTQTFVEGWRAMFEAVDAVTLAIIPDRLHRYSSGKFP